MVLQVTVQERNGAYVEGLGQDAFSVIEDGQPQTVRLFSDADTPVTVGLLVDSSSSMHASRSLVIAGAVAFADTSHPRDELFALAFNEGVRPALDPSAPFTRDRVVLRDALERTVTARGRTALYDAIAVGVDYLAHGTREREALLVLSDGGDNASRATRSRGRSQGAGVRCGDLHRRVDRPVVARRESGAARGTGPGERRRRVPPPRSPRSPRRSVGRPGHPPWLHAGYAPTNPAHDGAFRRVRVVVTAPPGRRFVVRTRSGYVAGSPTP